MAPSDAAGTAACEDCGGTGTCPHCGGSGVPEEYRNQVLGPNEPNPHPCICVLRRRGDPNPPAKGKCRACLGTGRGKVGN